MARGKFITLEGGEGAGKSTQASMLAESLSERGIKVVQTREVGGCPTAEEIRTLWLHAGEGHWDRVTELLLINAARREHVVRTILPALDAGQWVVSDRFVDSTRAYQGIGLGLGLDVVNQMHHLVMDGIEADLTLLLDMPVDAALARMKARGGQDDRYQQKEASFHQKLRDAFLNLAKAAPARFAVINAAREKDIVAADIWAAVAARMIGDSA